MTNEMALPRSVAEAELIHQTRNALVYDPPEIFLDETVNYTLGGSLSVPQKPGVYLIHDLRGVLYIGRTANLHQRYFQHYWDSHNCGVTAVLKSPVGRLEFSWITTDLSIQAELERDLIRAIQPLCNRLLYRNN
jgi:predicted GIY-YIG superfamily endonuclease